MQLKKKFNVIRDSLALASTSLLAIQNNGFAAELETTNVSISQLRYDEAERVVVDKTQVSIKTELNDDDDLKFDFIYDTMSGASPNGRWVNEQFDSEVTPVTTASGFSFDVSSDSSAQTKPWMTEFTDTRLAGLLDWSRRWTSNFTSSFSGSYSTENDYSSLGGAGKVAIDLNQKSTTLTTGVSIYNDTVAPKQGIPKALSPLWCEQSGTYTPIWLDCGQAEFYKSGNKITNDAMIGVTQIWNQRTVVQVNYAIGKTEGYLSDPYKLVSTVDASFGESGFVYERRPDEKLHQRLFFKLVNMPGENVINASYRFYWDDWGVTSHTLDFRFRFEFSPRFYLQPHLRANYQTAADFFKEYIVVSELEPDHVTADHRLGQQKTVTAGLKFGAKLSSIHQISLRGEYMAQFYDSTNLPDMSVTIIQLIYSTKF